MTENFEIQTVSDAMETMSDKDLAFIAAYNPRAMHSLCTMWALELELKKEGSPREILRLDSCSGSNALRTRIRSVVKNAFIENAHEVEYQNEARFSQQIYT